MSRVVSICIGLLKASVVALVLALCGFGSASAHEAGRHVAAPAAVTTHHHPVTAADDLCVARSSVTLSSRLESVGAVAGDYCCPGTCACSCAAACASHFVTNWPSAAILLRPVPLAVRLPGGALDPAGLTTPPEPRPPLSI